MVSKGAEFVPVIGSAAKYSRKAMQITKMADPVRGSTRAVGYGAEVEAHFFWQDRDQLAFWMKNFLTQEIDDESF